MEQALRLFAVLVIGALSAISACAAFVTASETLSETITSGIDTVGLFGPEGASLAGDTVTVEINWRIQPGPPYTGQNLGLEYQGYDFFVGPFGGLQETVTINSKAFPEDGEGGEGSDISGVDGSGIPVGLSLSDDVIGVCADGCGETEVKTNLNLAAVTGTILNQAGADALFAAVTGGTLIIYPYLVGCSPECPTPDPYPPGDDSLTFVTSPEPGTWLAMALGLCGIGVVRRPLVVFRRQPFTV